MSLNKKVLFIILTAGTIAMATGCSASRRSPANPHEADPKNHRSLKITEKDISNFSQLKSIESVSELASYLLRKKNFLDKEIYTDEIFLEQLSRFQIMLINELKSKKNHDKIVNTYLSFFLDPCLDNHQLEMNDGCAILEGMAKAPSSADISFFLLESRNHTLTDEDFRRLLVATMILNKHNSDEDHIPHFIADNLLRIRKITKNVDKILARKLNQLIEFSLTELKHKKNYGKLRAVIEQIKPEMIDMKSFDPINKDRIALFSFFADIHKNNYSLLNQKLSDALKADSSSYLNRANALGSDLDFIKKQAPEPNLCTYIVDRIYNERIDASTASVLFNKINLKSDCLESTKLFLATQILLESNIFFTELKNLITSLKSGNTQVANADILNKLKEKFTRFATDWDYFFERADSLQNFALTHFSNGNQDKLNELIGLRRALVRNILMYVQFPINLSLINALEDFSNVTIGRVSLVYQSITTLIENLLLKGLYVLDFELDSAGQQILTRAEILASFDFAVRTKIFEKMGTSPINIMKTIANNLQVEVHNAIQDDLSDRIKALSSSSYQDVKAYCLDKYREFNSTSGYQAGPQKMDLINLGSNLFINPDAMNGYIGTFHNKLESLLGSISQQYLYNYSIIDQFYQILRKYNNESKLAVISEITDSRKQLVSKYLSWYRFNLIEYDRCSWTYYKESWRRLIGVLNYEAKFLELIHDQMSALRNNKAVSTDSYNLIHQLSINGIEKIRSTAIDQNYFYMYKVPLLLRLAHYLENGLKTKQENLPAIAENVLVTRNLTKFEADEFSNHNKFVYHKDKKVFVERILRFLLLPNNSSGYLSIKFLSDAYHRSLIGINGLANLYTFNYDFLDSKNIVDLKDLMQSNYRAWDTAIINYHNETYDTNWILKNSNLSEKFKPVLNEERSYNQIFFKRTTIRPPYNYIIDRLILTDTASAFKNNPEEDANSGDPSGVQFASLYDQTVSYYRDRASMLSSLFPIPNDILKISDDLHKNLIETTYEKINHIVCKLRGKESAYLTEFDILSPSIKNEKISLDSNALNSDLLINNEPFIRIDSFITQFSRALPHELRDKPGILPEMTKYKQCSQGEN